MIGWLIPQHSSRHKRCTWRRCWRRRWRRRSVLAASVLEAVVAAAMPEAVVAAVLVATFCSISAPRPLFLTRPGLLFYAF